MLLFIDYHRKNNSGFRNISKHLMLLFIIKEFLDGLGKWLFQNISCYCLSANSEPFPHIYVRFQNISCYCLSNSKRFIPPLQSTFQNISCYCLSTLLTYKSICISSFQNISCYCLSPIVVLRCYSISHFKTSHVIVYRST